VDDQFYIVVPRALGTLYQDGKTGHWADVRTTSEAILALLTSGEGVQAPHIQCACDFLLAGFKTEEKGGSWGSELWDTALAIRALQKLAPRGQDTIEKAFDWIYTKQLPDGSFDGEPWDSLFVCLAALEAGYSDRVLKTIDWLISLQTSNGVVISSHYSGLFCQVLGRSLDFRLPSEAVHRVREAGIRALQFLWNQYSPASLWGEGTWTNAYIVRGMLALKHPQLLPKYDDIISWYARRQADSGIWDDTVRTAIVLQSLVPLHLTYELDRCNRKPLQALTSEFVERSTESQLFQMISSKTHKVPLVRVRKLIDHDENGNRVITLTKEREMYIGMIVSLLGALWALIRNWDFVKHFLFR